MCKSVKGELSVINHNNLTIVWSAEISRLELIKSTVVQNNLTNPPIVIPFWIIIQIHLKTISFGVCYISQFCFSVAVNLRIQKWYV